MDVSAAVLREVLECCAGTLGEVPAASFARVVPGESWTVGRFVAHVCEGLLWYAVDMSAGPAELDVARLSVRAEASPAELLRALRAHGAVLAAVLDATPDSARGWEPWGVTDRSGMAAIACDELLVHTWDVARGVGTAFVPSSSVTEAVLRRLFPWAPVGGDPWARLLAENDRDAGAGAPAPVGPGWRWHCAPLAEWGGGDRLGR